MLATDPQVLRAGLARLPLAARRAIIEALPAPLARALAWDWGVWARPAQLPPPGDWRTWLVMSGRGAGKTRMANEWVRARVRAGAQRIAFVGRTAADVRDVMVEGPSGILAVSPDAARPRYEPSKRRLTWRAGGHVTATGTCFSADEPDRLRGPQHDTAFCDELAAWAYPQAAWDNLQLGMRLGDPRTIITTTPRPLALLKMLRAAPSTRTTRESTHANAAHLAAAFLAEILKYEGTRLGRQELYAELLEDIEGARWTQAMLDPHRIAPTTVRDPAASPPPPLDPTTAAGRAAMHAPRQVDLARIVVALDPAVSAHAASAETGIIVVGIDATAPDPHGYVLADASGIYSPLAWGRRVRELYDRWHADAVVGEVNQGGDLIASNLRATSDAPINFQKVWSRHGKTLRADPIANLYERGLIHHAGVFLELETQMTAWVAGTPGRCDRLDALVHGLTYLLLPPGHAHVPTATSYGGADEGPY